MTLLEEILLWSKELPAWQSDALARLLAKQRLDQNDQEDVLALLKAAHGIADSKNRTPKPLTADQLPVSHETGNHVVLNAVKNFHHVNAIAENQRLEFGATGLTIIYGDNGSGKSGYSRVLKRACRARDQNERIHPNVNLSSDQHGTAQATFEITADGRPMQLQWADSRAAPPELSSLAIFDSRCARAYLDDENDFSYVPYGLDVFESLGKLCKEIQNTLEREKSQSAPDLTAFTHLHGPTTVGNLIANLSAKTLPATVEKLAQLTEEEKARHDELAVGVNENNPKEKAQNLRKLEARISIIAEKSNELVAMVSTIKVQQLKKLCDEYRAAKDAAAIAANEIRGTGNLLPGTGGDAWRELFEAARKFALESHPGKLFSNLGEESLCPLCQEPLGHGVTRLRHFEEFLEKESERVAKEKQSALALVYTPFSLHRFDVGLDLVTHEEIEALQNSLGDNIRHFEVALKDRHAAVLNAAKSNDWTGLEDELTNPSPLLKALASQLISEADTLQKAADDTTRLTLQREFDELAARVQLSKSKESVLNAISKLIHQVRLTACIKALKTNAISVKAAELTEQAVSQELAEALNTEFAALGVGNMKVALKSRIVRGKPLHKLTLNVPHSKNPADILSEGEQRAISIGSFLAEVNLLKSNSGVIFDDPMSSLDHRRRERVAGRLAAEASKRQVIIFTHDIYFVCLLVEEAQSAGIPFVTQSLTRRSTGFGVSDSELPFEGRKTKQRIGALKAQHQEIVKLHRDGAEDEWAKQTTDAYFRLRMTWERAVEEVLFRGVVLRFRKGIQTQQLSEVVVEDADYNAVFQGMTKCSNYAHDKAQQGGFALPEPSELLTDIEKLESWRTSVEARVKITSIRRKARA